MFSIWLVGVNGDGVGEVCVALKFGWVLDGRMNGCATGMTGDVGDVVMRDGGEVDGKMTAVDDGSEVAGW